MLLTTLTATSIGYAIASLLPAMLANLLTQVLVVFILMFSPLNFPANRLPGGWPRSTACCRSRRWAR